MNTQNQNIAATDDPFDPRAFAVSPAALVAAQGDTGVVPQLTSIRVGKPDKQAFFRTNPDPAFAMVAPILELKAERETYLMVPAVAATLPPADVKMCELRLCQTRQGSLFLWTVPVLSEDARQRNEWHVSARQVMAASQSKWVRMTADMASGRYNMAVASITAEPLWPEDMNMRDLLELAFGKERLITSASHPVVKRLAGAE
jgi:hypothetical protein